MILNICDAGLEPLSFKFSIIKCHVLMYLELAPSSRFCMLVLIIAVSSVDSLTYLGSIILAVKTLMYLWQKTYKNCFRSVNAVYKKYVTCTETVHFIYCYLIVKLLVMYNISHTAVADLGTGATGARPPFSGGIRKFFNVDLQRIVRISSG